MLTLDRTGGELRSSNAPRFLLLHFPPIQLEAAADVIATTAGAHEAVLWFYSVTVCGQFGSGLALEIKNT